jgi:DNA polymerase III subunit chi
MTDIAFHFNVPDKLAYSCRLLRKAYLSGARVGVTAAPEVLAELDAMLWQFSPTEFVPHCTDRASASTLAVTPILLAESLADFPHHDVLVNLGLAIPAGFEGFERCIEVVALPPEDVHAGRVRWKHYVARGYALTRHDLAQSGSSA